MNEDQSSIANSVSRNTSADLETSISVNSGRTKKGRKRKHLYSKAELESKKNSNIQYKRNDGTLIEPKLFNKNYTCPCKLNKNNIDKCTSRVSAVQREHPFKIF